MRKTKHEFLDGIAILAVTLLSSAIAICAGIGGWSAYSKSFHIRTEADVSLVFVTVLLLSMFALGVALTYGFNRVLARLLQCDVVDMGSNRQYPNWAYVVKMNDNRSPGEILSRDSKKLVSRRRYSVGLIFTKAELLRMMTNRINGAYCEIPHSYILPNGVSCLLFPRITLRDVFWATAELRTGEKVIFVYSVSYPDKKSRLAHSSPDGQIVIVDGETGNVVIHGDMVATEQGMQA